MPKLFELMEMLELAFTRDTFSYDGKFFKLPETHIAARPKNRRSERTAAQLATDVASQRHTLRARQA